MEVKRGEFRAGRAYVDVGTLHGYREAIRLLSGGDPPATAALDSAAAAAHWQTQPVSESSYEHHTH